MLNIDKSRIEIVTHSEYPEKIEWTSVYTSWKGFCVYCCEMKDDIAKRRLNTQYENEESNYVTCCESCYEGFIEYYEEQWLDYWSGRL